MADELTGLDKWLDLVERRGDNALIAYYYSFEPTGDPGIDALLASFATAGKLAHHTDTWADEWWVEDYGGSPQDMIQALAIRLAAERKESNDG